MDITVGIGEAGCQVSQLCDSRNQEALKHPLDVQGRCILCAVTD
jgi:hypothetical protein